MARRDPLTRSRRRKAEQLLAQGRAAEALPLLEKLVERDGADPALWLNFGAARAMTGQREGAEAALRRAIELDPDLPQPRFNLAQLLLQRGAAAEALPHLRTALARQPRNGPGWALLGRAAHATGALAEARKALERALELLPPQGALLNDLALVLDELDEPEAAEAAFGRALALEPRNDRAWANLGNLQARRGRFEQARRSFEKALAIAPGNAATLVSLGHLLASEGRLEEALEPLDRAVALQPGYAGARWNRALVLLALGRWKEGWADYEWRFQCPEVVGQIGRVESALPRWRGQPLDGRALRVVAEQGLGDTLQFCRYLPLLVERGARVTFVCPAPLVALLKGIEGVEVVEQGSEPERAFDFQVPLMSLPHHFATTPGSVPAAVPYLHADPARLDAWRARLAGEGAKVGLVWRGNPANWRDASRSLALERLAPLAAVEGVRFFSLQVGEAARAELERSPFAIEDLGPGLTDFGETAAAIGQLDLVVTVDTAVAHLAGALGRPVWLLLDTPSDWRWLREGDTTPWYPTMRLFRQPRPGAWDEAVARLASALADRFAPGG